MEPDARVRLSKRLSLALRHRPDTLDLELDAEGYAPVAAILAGLAARGLSLAPADLAEIVTTSDKQRFAFSADGARLRASQGHSVPVDLGLAPVPPPPSLHHGTVARFLAAIRAEGLLPRGRAHVHLSADVATAETVAARRAGPTVLLRVDAARMAAGGHRFYRSANGVWLTAAVPPEFLIFP